MLANAIQSSNGLLGYQNKIKEITRGKASRLLTYYLDETGGRSRDFFPGEGIFTKITSSSYTPPSGSGSHIKYIGFTRTGIIDTAPPYAGTFLLTLNANTNNNVLQYLPDGETARWYGYEVGYLANGVGAAAKQSVFGEGASPRSASGTSANPSPYPVDAGFLLKKRQWEKNNPALTGGTNPLTE